MIAVDENTFKVPITIFVLDVLRDSAETVALLLLLLKHSPIGPTGSTGLTYAFNYLFTQSLMLLASLANESFANFGLKSYF